MEKQTKIRVIENHLRRKCTEKGWTYKIFSGPKKNGIPDCVITTPDGTVLYVEMIIPEEKDTPLQRNDSLVASHGIHVFLVNSKENIDVLVNTIQTAIDANNATRI